MRAVLKQEEVYFEDIYYEPSVEDPYANLNKFLEKNQNIKVEIEQFTDIGKAVVEFMNKISNEKDESVVILTGLKLKPVIAHNPRKKRQANQQQKIVQSNTVTGQNCIAQFDSIYLYDQSNPTQNIKFFLNVSSSTFQCSNQSSTLVFSFID